MQNTKEKREKENRVKQAFKEFLEAVLDLDDVNASERAIADMTHNMEDIAAEWLLDKLYDKEYLAVCEQCNNEKVVVMDGDDHFSMERCMVDAHRRADMLEDMWKDGDL